MQYSYTLNLIVGVDSLVLLLQYAFLFHKSEFKSVHNSHNIWWETAK